MKIQNKIFIIFAISFLFIFLFNVKSFGSSDNKLSYLSDDELSEMVTQIDISKYENCKYFFVNGFIDEIFCFYTTDLEADFYMKNVNSSGFTRDAQ